MILLDKDTLPCVFSQKKNLSTQKKFLHLQSQTAAEIAQLVEHDLAKVGVASSSLVFRSKRLAEMRGVFVCGPVWIWYSRAGPGHFYCVHGNVSPRAISCTHLPGNGHLDGIGTRCVQKTRLKASSSCTLLMRTKPRRRTGYD